MASIRRQVSNFANLVTFQIQIISIFCLRLRFHGKPALYSLGAGQCALLPQYSVSIDVYKVIRHDNTNLWTCSVSSLFTHVYCIK